MWNDCNHRNHNIFFFYGTGVSGTVIFAVTGRIPASSFSPCLAFVRSNRFTAKNGYY
jgi:hypothetical protein